MTLLEAQALRTAAYSAYMEALKSEEYEFSDGGMKRKLKRQDIEKLKADFLYWDSEVKRIESSKNRVMYFTS